MNSGLQDAHNLAWKLATILKGGDARVLLSSYEAERKHAVTTGVERFTDLLTRFVLLAPPSQRNAFLILAGMATRFAFVRENMVRRATMLDVHYPRSKIVRGASILAGSRAPDGDIAKQEETKRLLDMVFPHALLVLFDDGKLPRWNEDEIRVSVQSITPTEVRVLRLAAQSVEDESAWRDASGEIFRAWKIQSAAAALLRPDGHIGWMAERPSREELQSGIKSALGAQTSTS
jgi:3-(3-hydroxy-phenyl)propionate hydroxylase